MEAKELTKLAVKALEDKKGEDIRVIDIHGVSVLADYFVIADGSNASQVKAMADNVEEELGKAGHECRQIEGYQTAGTVDCAGGAGIDKYIYDAVFCVGSDLCRDCGRCSEPE